MIEFNLSQIEPIINEKLRKSQILLAISVVISLSIVFINRNYVYWAFYFSFLAILALPNINKCKKDLYDCKNNNTTTSVGEVVDIFPVSQESDRWYIFLKTDKEVIEFITPAKPECIQIHDTLKISHTNVLQIPVKIEKE